MDQELHQIIQAAKQKNKQAFEKLVHRFKGQVYRQAYAMLHDRMEAEDVVQEAFVKMYVALPKFQSTFAFSAWLTRIVMNLCYDRLQKQKKERAFMVDWSKEHKNRLSSQEELEQKQMQMSIEEAMEQLSPEHHTMIVLRDIQGYSYDEIAKLLQIPKGTVKSRIHLARLSLREKMKKGGMI